MVVHPGSGGRGELAPGEVEALLQVSGQTLRLWARELGLDPSAPGYTEEEVARLERLHDLVVRQRYTLTGALLRLGSASPAESSGGSASGCGGKGDAAARLSELEMELARAAEARSRAEVERERAEARSESLERALATEREAHAHTRARLRAALVDLRALAQSLLDAARS